MKKISSITYVIVFLMVTGGIGTASFASLISYYDTGSVKNNEWTVELGSKLETDIATAFWGKTTFVNMNGAVHNYLGQQEMNGVVKLDNGYLLKPFDYIGDAELQHNADKIISLKNYLDQKEIPFIYVIPPYTSAKYDPQLPAGASDYGNDDLDRFSAMLRAGGVELIDIRETMHDDGMNAYDMMYRTDHHWTTRAGFYAYSKINDVLMQKLDCEVDAQVMDLSNYTITTYPKWHLGSNGQRTGAFYAETDDFDLILPNFDTSVSDGSEAGTFEDIIINKEPLQKRELTSRYTYDSVLSRAFDNFTNNQSANDKKILLMTDSYGRAVNPFLILSYGEVRTGIPDYETITEYDPDAVIILHYIANILEEDKYDDLVGMS